MNTTDDFKKLVQSTIQNKLGIKVSKDVAWEFYKSMNRDIIKFTVDNNGKVPLAGQVTYEIIESEPSPKRINEGYTKVYKFRTRQSTTLSRYLNKLKGQPSNTSL